MASFHTRTSRTAKNRRQKHVRLQVEKLESRQLLAVTTTFNAGVLTFTGNAANDTVIVEPTGATTVQYDDGATLGSVEQTGVTQIVFDAGDGNDTLIFINSLAALFSPTGGVQFNGAAGNDTLILASGTLAGVTGTYTVGGPDSGELRYTQVPNVLDLDFTGLELIQDTLEATTLTTEGSSGNETINIIDGPTLTPVSSFTQGPVILTGGDWEDTDHFRNCGAGICAETTVGQEVGFLRNQSFNGGNGILAIGASPDYDGSAGLAREAVNIVGAAIGETVTHVHATIPAFNNYVSTAYLSGAPMAPVFENIAGTGTLVSFPNDNSLATNGGLNHDQFDIGFDFTYFGITDRTVAIATDGYLSTVRAEGIGTDNSPDDGPNMAAPGGPPSWTGGGLGGNTLLTTPNGTIAGWWADLAPSLGTGEVRYQTLGTPGNQRFIVQYTNVQHQGGGNPVTFQIKLFENGSNVEVVYQAAPTGGAVHQVSVEHPLGSHPDPTAVEQTIGYRSNVALSPGDGFRFTPTGTAIAAVASTPPLESVDFNDYQVIYVATAGSQLDDFSGPNALDLGVLADRKDDVRDYVRGGGGLYVNTQQATEAEAGILGWLEIPSLFEVNNLGAANLALSLTAEGMAIGMPAPVQPNGNLAYHSTFTGPVGLNGLDVLVVDTANRWVTIGQGAINDSIGGGDSFEINGDLTTIQVVNKVTLIVNGNDGDDSINVGQPGDSLDIFGPNLVVNGGTGTNSLTVDDSGDLTGDTIIANATSITGLAPFDIFLASFNSVTVTATAGDDLIDVDFVTSGPAEFTIFGSTGNDVFGFNASIRPSLTTAMSFFGGDPTGVVPITPPGDQLNLDMTIAAEPIIIDTVGGIALSASHMDLLFGEMEDVDAVDVEDLQVGDLFVEGTPTSDRIVFNQHVLNNQLVRIGNVTYGPFFPTRKLVVYANAGNDFVHIHAPQPLPADIRGEGGNDYISSGVAGDTLLGGQGNDILLAGEGNNFLDGGIENDKLEGRSGNDTLFGGDGTDELIANSGNDILSGGTGHDRVFGGDGNDLLDLGAGNDTGNGWTGNDVILGGAGTDIIVGDRELDLVIGEGDADTLYGGDGNDVLTGDDFNATLRAAIDADLAALLASLGETPLSAGVMTTLGNWFISADDTDFQNYADDSAVDLLFSGTGNDIFRPTGTDDVRDFNAVNDTII